MNGDAGAVISSTWIFGIPAAVFLALLVPARWLRAFPSRPAVLLVLAAALVSFLLGAASWLWPTVLVVDALVVIAIAVDLTTGPRRSALSVERHTVRVCSLRKPHRIDLLVVNHGRRALAATVRDQIPGELEPKPVEHDVLLPRLSRTTLEAHVFPSRRGAFDLLGVSVRVQSRAGFWRRTLDYDVANELHVYPDLKQLAEYSVLARTNRLSLLGVRRTRRVGQDNEFERLRDYTPDDNYKHIDWRATARRNQLTVKDFQRTHNQRLIFMLDCGRMMTNESAGLSFLDHAFNSMLMLSHVALLHGDSVGMVTFSDDIHTFVPPKSGTRQMNRLLHASFNQFPGWWNRARRGVLVPFAALSPTLARRADHERRRRNQRSTRRGHLTNLLGRHLPLAVLLRP
ncbi:MAG: DUF58 domain-containing protein [Pirellulales bacterium]